MIAILPHRDQNAFPGERLVVERQDPDDPISIIEETTLPERVHLVDARRRTTGDRLVISADAARWLIEALIEALGDSPGTGWPPLNGYTDRALAGHLIMLRNDVRGRDEIVQRTYELRIEQAQRELARRNVRETRAQDADAELIATGDTGVDQNMDPTSASRAE